MFVSPYSNAPRAAPIYIHKYVTDDECLVAAASYSVSLCGALQEIKYKLILSE